MPGPGSSSPDWGFGLKWGWYGAPPDLSYCGRDRSGSLGRDRLLPLPPRGPPRCGAIADRGRHRLSLGRAYRGPPVRCRLCEALGACGRPGAGSRIADVLEPENRRPAPLPPFRDRRPPRHPLPALRRPRGGEGAHVRPDWRASLAALLGRTSPPRVASALSAVQGTLEARPRGPRSVARVRIGLLDLVGLWGSRVHVLARHPLLLDDEGGVPGGDSALGLVGGHLHQDRFPTPPVSRPVVRVNEGALAREEEAAPESTGTDQQHPGEDAGSTAAHGLRRLLEHAQHLCPPRSQGLRR